VLSRRKKAIEEFDELSWARSEYRVVFETLAAVV
jgi:hypothetical protein